ncbi:DUF916 and DUF3324 domain-containing protein [Vagococcus xieshaowenii]|uniref:DUF916 and DUF3324 domain-containing protein n=1 Tax=Vagococcus xieshaowenii TaxID=2562451 RepID=A0AAJ5EG96_9ENTE|nr:DUF916 and DUF3324 domain-containing protein [Vagococcus xieshaowenii]QCA29547.1 DUF916 and DUF3324 domain-containing protein [Vagococcus xieshaowenii]TFZ42663.1 DUF916 and DUF3324 domain-containing protein [Vagococcus xieshaowenii]
MNYWKKITLGLVGIFVLSLINPLTSFAENNVNAGVGYSVQKVSPGNEVNDASPFYDLKIKPGEKRTIEAKLINPSNEEITIESKLFTASTNINGEINYTSKSEEFDKSLKVKLSEVAEIAASDVKTTLAPKEEKIISTTINLPKDTSTGVILGSWYFEKLGQVKEDDQEGIVINNKYSYAIAIKLTVDKEIDQPNLNLLNITTGLNNYRKVINANIQNDQPALVANLTINAKIMKKGQYDVLYENSAEGIMMAPNSNFPFPIFLEDQPLKAGDYTMKLIATTDDPKWESQKWEWSEDFTITSDEAKKINAEAINDPDQPTAWWIYVVIGLGIVIIVLLLILVLKKRKKDEANG